MATLQKETATGHEELVLDVLSLLCEVLDLCYHDCSEDRTLPKLRLIHRLEFFSSKAKRGVYSNLDDNMMMEDLGKDTDKEVVAILLERLERQEKGK